jgi:hypothetical protein
MNKTSSLINWKEWKGTGVQSVDMVASAIFTHRLKYLPIKAIHLLPNMYDQFRLWLEKKSGKELEDGQGMQMDSVAIERGSVTQSTPLLIQLWEE